MITSRRYVKYQASIPENRYNLVGLKKVKYIIVRVILKTKSKKTAL
jgi:hypothetical protein